MDGRRFGARRRDQGRANLAGPPDGRVKVVATPGGGPNGAAIGPDGALYICNNGGFSWSGAEAGLMIPGGAAADYSGGRIERVDLATGKVERLYDSCDGVPLSGPNDIVFAAAGGMWFTDLGKHHAHHTDHGGLFYAQPDGSRISCAVRGPNMNGVGLSPDGGTVYAALTYERLLLAFAITGPGTVEPPAFGGIPGRVVTSFPAGPISTRWRSRRTATSASRPCSSGPASARSTPSPARRRTTRSRTC